MTKGNFTLTHDTYIDDYGFLCDRLEVVQHLPNGDCINYPIVGKMKVGLSGGNILDSTQGYNTKDLEEMLDDTIQELNK